MQKNIKRDIHQQFIEVNEFFLIYHFIMCKRSRTKGKYFVN